MCDSGKNLPRTRSGKKVEIRVSFGWLGQLGMVMQRNVMPESISNGLPGTVGPIPVRLRKLPAALATGMSSSALIGVKPGLAVEAVVYTNTNACLSMSQV